MFRFAHPWALLLLVPAVLAAFFELRRERRRRPSLRHSRAGDLARATSLRARLAALPWLLRAFALGAMVVALARPQSGIHAEERTTEGVDIVVCLDASGSMQAQDTPGKSRLEVAKETVARFVRGRPGDRMGLVVFAQHAFTRCPLTLDHALLHGILDDVSIAERNARTAIGMALATSVNRVKSSPAKSRVIVLLTDGRNNDGMISPLDAARIAAEYGIRVYTIGIGARGPARFPVQDPFGPTRYVLQDVDIDEDTLRDIAAATGGRAFRAQDEGALEEVFRTIDSLEKSEIRTRAYARYTERAVWAIGPALGALALGLVLSATVFRRVP